MNPRRPIVTTLVLMLGSLVFLHGLAPALAQSAKPVQIQLINTAEQKVDVYIANADGTGPRPLAAIEAGASRVVAAQSGQLIIFGINRRPFQRYATTSVPLQTVAIATDLPTARTPAPLQKDDTGSDRAPALAPSDCSAAMTTAEMNQCADDDLEQADAALNAEYQAALAAIAQIAAEPPYDPKRFEAALRGSQRAWIAWRDAECKELVPMFWTGGTGTTVAVLNCLSQKTKLRTQELEERFRAN
jgi:uncharacterized protein YecT (DUF1311 family)